MLFEFSLANFKSFRDKQTFSMVAGNGDEHQAGLFKHKDFDVLKTAVVYGSNGSGKSNVFWAFWVLYDMVRYSEQNPDVIKKIQPFFLDTFSKKSPSFFETVLDIDGIEYRYGFEGTSSEVKKEWLYEKASSRERELFVREKKKDLKINNKFFPEGKKFKDLFNQEEKKSTLFLSFAANLKGGEISLKIQKYFASEISIVKGGNDLGETIFHTQKYYEAGHHDDIVEFMKSADPTIEDISIKKPTEEDMQEVLKQLPLELKAQFQKGEHPRKISFLHKKYDKDGRFDSFESFAIEMQSDGTRKMFLISAFVLEALEKGSVLIIDEANSRLHPQLFEFIIDLFHSPIKNPKNAQLIVNTHDTYILNKVRRDQVWLTEKNMKGISKFYSLWDFSPRKDASLSKDYLSGKFGAIPSGLDNITDL